MGVLRGPRVLSLLLVCAAALVPHTLGAERPARRAVPANTSLPVMFEPVPAGDAFIAPSQGYSLRLTADGAPFLPRGAADGSAVTLRFAGGAAALRPERTLSTTLNILQGPRAAWRTGVHPFAAVRMAHVYDGVDAVFYGHGERIEYDLVVAPGASVDQVRVRFEGAQRIELDGTDLRVVSGRHTMTHHAPLAYQEIAGRRTEVPAHYSLHADDTVGFDVADYDRTAPLVIDPTISYSSYIGATGRDLVRSITTDAAGNAYLAGDTEGGDLPGSAGTTHGQFSDAYVAKLRGDGTPEWVTILGGTNQPDAAMAVAAGPTGDVYVTGFSWSADFPVTAGAYRGTTEHTCDAFVARIGSDGGLKYSTMLGAPQPWGVGCGMRAAVVDPQGRAIVAGATASPSFTPTFGDSVGPLAPGLDQPDALVASGGPAGPRREWPRRLPGPGFAS